MEMANPLESFGESPKACVTNSNRLPAKLKGKGNPDLPSVCSNYWPPIVALSLCLTIWYFRPFSNAGLQSPRNLPSPQPLSTTQFSTLRETSNIANKTCEMTILVQRNWTQFHQICYCAQCALWHSDTFEPIQTEGHEKEIASERIYDNSQVDSLVHHCQHPGERSKAKHCRNVLGRVLG